MRKHCLLGLVLLVSPVFAQPVDNCATLLGSISVELRAARNLAPARRTSFTCPRDTDALLGASKQRILNSLGAPDATFRPDEASSAIEWSYYFSSSAAGYTEAGIPQLTFSFDEGQQVGSVRCQRTTQL
jgi:hypothetical protein